MSQRIIILLLLLFYHYFAFAKTGEDCTTIKPPVLRLACFDEVFQTPIDYASPSTVDTQSILSKDVSQIYELIDDYAPQTDGIIMSKENNTIKIALRSSSENAFSPVIFLGCIDNITHFQVALKHPIKKKKLLVTISDADSERKLFSNEWQVLEHGHLLDIGRGLFAIEKIKKMLKTTQITFQIVPLKHYWHFNIENLAQHIEPLRKSCGW